MQKIKEIQELMEFLNGYTDLAAEDILDSIPELGYRIKEDIQQ